MLTKYSIKWNTSKASSKDQSIKSELKISIFFVILFGTLLDFELLIFERIGRRRVFLFRSDVIEIDFSKQLFGIKARLPYESSEFRKHNYLV